MSDAITMPAAPVPPPSATSSGTADATLPTLRYGAGGARKSIMCFVFLILLPFWISLPMMMIQRLTKGIVLDTAGLGLLAFFFTLLMVLVVFELVLSLRARVEVGATGVRTVLPSRGGILPMLGYRKNEVLYSDIEKIELRRECYGGAMAPVLLRGARIIKKDGTTVPLGYVSEADMDPTFPVPEIAAEIAKRAGVELTEMGSVHRQIRKKMFGIKATDAENTRLSDEQISHLNTSHNRLMLLLIAALAVLLVLGIGSDIMTGNIDRGELARDAVQKR